MDTESLEEFQKRRRTSYLGIIRKCFPYYLAAVVLLVILIMTVFLGGYHPHSIQIFFLAGGAGLCFFVVAIKFIWATFPKKNRNLGQR